MEPLEQERLITDLEKQIDRLRALYDQYFLGIERIEPLIPRKQVERLLTELRKVRMNNTAQRFRFQQQVQRYSTLGNYWQRVARQIEEGTYRRDIMRARARLEEDAAGQGPARRRREALPTHEIDLDELDDEPTDPGLSPVPPEALPPPSPQRLERPAEPSMAELLAEMASSSRPAGPPPRRPPPSPAAGASPVAGSDRNLSHERMQDIYKRFVAARQSCNEPVKGLSFDRVREELRSREQALLAKHGKAVDFEVTVKDGKAILRAVPRGGNSSRR